MNITSHDKNYYLSIKFEFKEIYTMLRLSKFVFVEISRDYVVIFQSLLRRILIPKNIPSWADISLFTLPFAVFSCYLLKASYPTESSYLD